jgi:putative ABC transport system permease protein
MGGPRIRGILALACGLVAFVCLRLADFRPLFFVGYLLTIAAALLLGPFISTALAQMLRPALTRLRPVEGALAADSLIQAPRRAFASVAGVMLSLALVVAFAGMARASYASVVDWIDTTLNSDLFVMPSQRLDLRTTRFPATMASELAAIPGVQRVQTMRYNRMTLQGKPVMIAAIEMNSFAETTRSDPVAGDRRDMYRSAAAGEGLIISDNFAQLRNLTAGDPLEIPAPYGTIRLPVVGIIVDYTDQMGTIFMDRSVFTTYWHDDAISDFHVWLAPDANAAEVREAILKEYEGRRHVFVLTNEEGRRYILRIADQWFSLMDVQIAVAVLVAILGIVNSLTVSIMDRRRELGVLQAVGGLRSQIRQTIWLEAVSIAVIGTIAGAAFGAINLYYLLEIVQRDTIGLRLDYEYPMATVGMLVPIMLMAASAAALWPSQMAVRAPLVESLAYE